MREKQEPSPPPLARLLLSLLLPTGIRGEAILGDLEQEFLEVVVRTSARGARAWYRRQAVRVLMEYRLRSLLSRPSGPGGSATLGDLRRASAWSLVDDLRYGGRRLARAPFFSAVAIVTIGIGIGANTAIFSVLDAVLIRPPPYPDPERLVQIWETSPEVVANRGLRYTDISVNALNYEFYEAEARAIEALGWTMPYADDGRITISSGEESTTEVVEAVGVSPSFFDVLGARPALGRGFLPEERAPAGEMRWTELVVLSHDLWVRRFASDPGIVGRVIRLDGGPSTVVGVLPRGFEHPSLSSRGVVVPRDVDVYLPMYYPTLSQSRRNRHYAVVGRLRPGVSPEAAQEEMTVLAARLAEEYPESMATWTAVVTPLHDLLVRDFGGGLTTLMAMVGFVLLIACANVSNLLLARGATRRGELAIRAAIGGGRRRLAQLLLAESFVLAVLGAIVGAALARGGTGALIALIPATVPQALDAGLGTRVLAFTVLVAVLTALLMGLAPVLRFSSPGLGGNLSGRPGQEGRGGWRVSRALISVQVGLTLMLLAGGGILGRSFLTLRTVDRGYDPAGVRSVTIKPGAHHDLVGVRHADLERRRARWVVVTRTLEALRSVPGVEAVAVGSVDFNDLGVWPMQFTSDDPPGRIVNSTLQYISPEYFETLGIPIVRGEGLRAWDGENDWRRYWWSAGCEADVLAWCQAMVSETFASTVWPGEDPIGKELGVYGCCWRVAGVVADVNARGIDSPRLSAEFDPGMRVYVPYAEVGSGFLVRAEGDERSMANALRAAVASVDPLSAVTVSALEEQILDSLAGPRFYSFVVGLFALMALLLALVGLHGVVSYIVSRRSHEIGIRMALGAHRLEVGRMVLAEAMMPAGVGVVLGGLATIGGARALEGLLYGTRALDPVLLGVVAAGLLLVCALSCLFPARRASAVDPVRALAFE